MGIGDIYRTINKQTLQGQTVMNVYYFEQTAGTGGATELNVAWVLDILPAIQAIQVEALTHQSVESENLDSELDYDLLGLNNATGDQSAQHMPSFVAWSFIQTRTSKATRHGHKRVAGVSEDEVANGVVIGTQVPALNAYAEAIASPIADALGAEFVPVIVRNPDDAGTRVVNPVSGASYQRVTSQNTRKPGVGI